MTKKERFLKSRAYKYALFCADNNNFDKIPKYVRLQCQKWLRIVNNETPYHIDYKIFIKINKLLKVMILPDNPNLSIYKALDDYAYLFIVAVLCTKDKNDNRLYTNALLEIARKNHKSFTVAIIMIIQMILDNSFTRYFSVAPTLALSKEVQIAIKKIIGVSPLLRKEFKVNRDYVKFKSKENEFYPLAYSNDSLDGRLTPFFVVDECGLLKNAYPIESLRSSQIELKNKTCILISTKYPTIETTPFEEEISRVKDILDGKTKNDDRYFALLYEPDEEIINNWSDSDKNDSVIYHSNPNSINNTALFNEIKDKIELCKIYPSRKENVLTKHLNILYQTMGGELYIEYDNVMSCLSDDKFDCRNKNIYCGIDLADKSDNTSLTIGYYENGNVYAKNIIFVAEDCIEEKIKKEHVDYYKLIEDGYCIIAGDNTCDYNVICDYILNFIEENNCRVMALGYDQRNAGMLVYQLERNNVPCVEIPQHASVLNEPLKYLRKMILDNNFYYQDSYNYIAENYINAKVFHDNNLNI